MRVLITISDRGSTARQELDVLPTETRAAADIVRSMVKRMQKTHPRAEISWRKIEEEK